MHFLKNVKLVAELFSKRKFIRQLVIFQNESICHSLCTNYVRLKWQIQNKAGKELI